MPFAGDGRERSIRWGEKAGNSTSVVFKYIFSGYLLCAPDISAMEPFLEHADLLGQAFVSFAE